MILCKSSETNAYQYLRKNLPLLPFRTPHHYRTLFFSAFFFLSHPIRSRPTKPAHSSGAPNKHIHESPQENPETPRSHLFSVCVRMRSRLVMLQWVWILHIHLLGGWMGCMVSQLAAKFAFFPPSPPTYQIKKRDDGKLTVVSSSSPSMPIPLADDNSLDVLLIDTKRGNKIVAFYLRNPCARLTLLYSHGNAADLGQLYDLFVQLKVNLRVNLMGLVPLFLF